MPVLNQWEVSIFVRTGQLSPISPAIMEIHHVLRRFLLGKRATRLWSSNLRVTTGFSTTVKSQSTLDDYTNSVNRILTSSLSATQMIWLLLSAFEANALLDSPVRRSKFVHLHVCAPNIRRILPVAADFMFFFNISGFNIRPGIDQDLG